jgi:hypothetical protein
MNNQNGVELSVGTATICSFWTLSTQSFLIQWILDLAAVT